MMVFIVFFISVVLSFCSVLVVLKLSHRKGWYDNFDERKIHTENIPRLGGIGFAFAFFIILTGIGVFYRNIGVNITRFLPCAAAMFFMLVSGAYDDFRSIAPRYKLLLQIVAALCVIVSGFTFDRLVYIGDGFFTELGIWTIPITFLWIVGFTNAINFIDGVDGLAGGLSALIVFFLGIIIFSFAGISKAVLLCTCLFGVLIGFLILNAPIPRARIFMGDGGSQFLGFALALLPVMKDTASPDALPVLYAAALFSIPIFDATASVWRRIRDGKKIYNPDKAHLHHKLMNLGLSARGVIAVIFILQIIVGVLTLTAVRLQGIPSLYVLCSVYLIVLVFFIVIHYMNRRVKENGSGLESKNTGIGNTCIDNTGINNTCINAETDERTR